MDDPVTVVPVRTASARVVTPSRVTTPFSRSTAPIVEVEVEVVRVLVSVLRVVLTTAPTLATPGMETAATWLLRVWPLLPPQGWATAAVWPERTTPARSTIVPYAEPYARWCTAVFRLARDEPTTMVPVGRPSRLSLSSTTCRPVTANAWSPDADEPDWALSLTVATPGMVIELLALGVLDAATPATFNPARVVDPAVVYAPVLVRETVAFVVMAEAVTRPPSSVVLAVEVVVVAERVPPLVELDTLVVTAPIRPNPGRFTAAVVLLLVSGAFVVHRDTAEVLPEVTGPT